MNVFRLSVVVLMFFVSTALGNSNKNAALEVGNYLIVKTANGEIENVTSDRGMPIVRIGESLRKKLASLQASFKTSCQTQWHFGDSQFGDGEATEHIYLVCDDSKLIGIRLKYDVERGKHHTIGVLD